MNENEKVEMALNEGGGGDSPREEAPEVEPRAVASGTPEEHTTLNELVQRAYRTLHLVGIERGVQADEAGEEADGVAEQAEELYESADFFAEQAKQYAAMTPPPFPQGLATLRVPSPRPTAERDVGATTLLGARATLEFVHDMLLGYVTDVAMEAISPDGRGVGVDRPEPRMNPRDAMALARTIRDDLRVLDRLIDGVAFVPPQGNVG